MKAQSLNPSEEKSLGLREKGRPVSAESTQKVFSTYATKHACGRMCTHVKLSTTNKQTYTFSVCVPVCEKAHRRGEIYVGPVVAASAVCFTVYLGNSRVERVPSGLRRWMANFPLWLWERVIRAWTCSRELTYSGRPQQASTLLLNISLFPMSLQVWQVERKLVNVMWLQTRTHNKAAWDRQ